MDDATVAVRYLLAFAMLAGAIPSDLRTRRVSNLWWVPFGVLAGILTVSDFLAPDRDWLRLALAYGTAVVVCALLYAMWYFRLFGGADAKALMVLAFLAPWPSPAALLAIAPALDALANGSLLMLAVPVGTLLYNLVRGDLALPAALLGRPVPIVQARAAHVWPMQRVDADGRVRWRFWQKAGLESLDAEYEALERAGRTTVWTTAKVPFLVPLAAGLALGWWPGNLVVLLVERLLGR